MFSIDAKPPKYRQLQEYLKQKILSGVYKPGTRVPSEHQLIREFGLSNTTVQKAISSLVYEGLLVRHQGKGTFVAEDVKEKVRETQKKNDVQFVIEHTALADAISSSQASFRYLDIIRGISEAAADSNCSLTIQVLSHEETAQATAGRILDAPGAIGALIVTCNADREIAEILKKEKVFFAVVDPSCDDTKRIPFNSFSWDAYQGVHDLTRYLLKTGYRRIGTLGLSGSAGRRSIKEKALREVLSESEVACNEYFFLKCGPSSFDAFVEMHRLLEGGELPEVIMAGSDEIAFGAMSALMEKGLRIPEDIAVVGFGDVPESSRSTPALTTVREPRYELGRAAFEKILDCHEKKLYDFEPVVFPMETVLRETCRTSSREYLR
jgi:GntR family transcriptional regulator of arabinose operon